jgi:hydroxymethylglutaryl-CoA synthase
LNDLDFVLFHSPYSKLVQKSFGRLLYNDFLADPSTFPAETQEFLTVKDPFTNKDLEKHFMQLTKEMFTKKTVKSMIVNKNVGNMYCASLYGALCGLISEVDASDLLGKRIAMFSYGSGLASTMFSLRVVGDTSFMKSNLQVKERLEQRQKMEAKEYDEIMQRRERVHNVKDYCPGFGDVFKGTYVLEKVDELYRRTYRFVE